MSDSEARGGIGREDAIRLVRRWFHDYWNGKDPDVLDEVLHEQCVHRNVMGTERQDREGWKVELAAVRSAIPNVRFDINDVLVDGNRVAVWWTMSGRHTADGLGFPPTGRSFAVDGMGFATVTDGRFILVEEMWDRPGFLVQLGQA
jgi:steroid delta-isomerase-like uncharacterized protein